ncbi:hypothetical protein [Actinomadura rudentiformis]|uniref:Small secreted protein n=1 Tax=Actinomadura rudentiformis TaxID=359158 RepID=A0A6H9YL99_9ACTN|nr:hypothetical protein [Actinomadura rudentiformis]KAB2347279.1 hypothetical protein F8566_19890 [Actinomadura rudentiformis]
MRNGAQAATEAWGAAATRARAARLVVGGTLVMSLGACGLVGGGDNTSQVCTETKQAYQQYITKVKGASAADPAQWKQVTDQLAGKIDGLAKKAEKKKLKKALTDEAARLRTAAASVGTGDAAQLNAAMSGTPERIGNACS